MAVHPPAVRSSSTSHPAAALGAPPPEQGFWARWWSIPRNRVRTLVPLGLLALLFLFGLFMDLTGR